MRKYASGYMLVIGLGMFGIWAMLLATGQVPELETEPWRIALHLTGEGLTALSLIAGGVGLARRAPWGRTLALFALGMLTYTLVVSPGYYAQLGDWAFVGMFSAFVVAGVPALAGVWRAV